MYKLYLKILDFIVSFSAGIKPGASRDGDITGSGPVGQLSPVDSLLDLVRNLIPANIVYASFAQLSTWRVVTAVTYDCNGVDGASMTNYESCPSTSVKYDLSDPKTTFDKPVTCPFLDVSDSGGFRHYTMFRRVPIPRLLTMLKPAPWLNVATSCLRATRNLDPTFWVFCFSPSHSLLL